MSSPVDGFLKTNGIPPLTKNHSSGRFLPNALQQLFDVYAKEDIIRTEDLRNSLKLAGLTSPVIKESLSVLDPEKTGKITFEAFKKIKELRNSVIVEKALKGNLIIPDWASFVQDLEEICNLCKKNRSGMNATYIPQLANVDPEQFSVSVCTIDGQTWNYGDYQTYFTIQSCSKPVTYCMAELDRGAEYVTKHVGHEPSGKAFNAFELNRDNIPHNPMINSGAMMTASLLKPSLEPAERFDYVMGTWNSMISTSRHGFDNSTFLSELRHADRNFALAYFMKDVGAFDEHVKTADDLRKHVEFYFQLCSITGTTQTMAEVAATFANGGVQPVNGNVVFPSNTVRNCLSLMYSCGMYDYSGEFAYKVGLPAKSGVAGCIMLVVPNLCGIAVWSPRLDKIGNSVRGVMFCEELTRRYAFHIFDDVSSKNLTKKNPRVRTTKNANLNLISEMCHAASDGDIGLLRLLIAGGASAKCADYDKRTPLHLACAEGHFSAAKYLIEMGADPDFKDRWDTTPRQEAENGGHKDILDYLDTLKH